MVYPPDHPDPTLRGLPKGMKAVLQERESVWDELVANGNGRVVGKCKSCSKSQAKKDAERQVAEAESMGQENTLADDIIAQAQEPMTTEPASDWCCMYHALSLQEDFATEKPKNRCSSIILKIRDIYVCFFPSFIANSTPLKCSGVMPSTVSP